MSLSVEEIIRNNGYYDKNNRWNAVIEKGGKYYRERVEIIIVNELGQIYARVYKSEDKCRFPGGSINKYIPNDIQASNECKEEANIIIKDVKYSNISYIDPYDIIFDNNVIIQLHGRFNHIYTGLYKSEYTAYVNPIDRDNDILYNGKFYSFNELEPYMNKYQMEAYIAMSKPDNVKSPLIYYPYYTPFQMEELGVYGESANDNYYGILASVDNIDWFNTYKKSYNPGTGWKNKLLDLYVEYGKDPSNLSIKQSILELGWNPEIDPFNDNILLAISYSTKNILNNIKRVDSLRYNRTCI